MVYSLMMALGKHHRSWHVRIRAPKVWAEEDEGNISLSQGVARSNHPAPFISSGMVIVSSMFRTMYGYRARTWAGTGSVCSSYAAS